MSKKYSKADLLGEELYLASGQASWKYKLMCKLINTKRVPLTIKIPQTYLGRSLMICEDLKLITGENQIELVMIIDILIKDFIYELARTNTGPLPAYQYLLDRHTQSLQVKHYLNDQVEEVQLDKKVHHNYTSMRIVLDRKALLRLEWFLYDLEEEMPNHGFTVETLIEVLFCYFVELVKKGEAEKAIRLIIRNIQKETED